MKSFPLVSLLASVGWLVTSTSGLAAANAPAEASLTVEIYLSPEELRASLAERLERELKDSQLSYQLETTEAVSIERVLSDSSLDAAFSRPQLWVSWAETRADIYLRDRRKDRVYVRRLDARDRNANVRQEELIELVRSLVESLAEGAEIGMHTSEARRLYAPQPKAAESKPETLSAWRPGAFFSYELGAESREIPARHGVAWGGAFFFVNGTMRLGVGLQVGFSPASFQVGPLTTHLDRLSLRPFVRLESQLGEGFAWSVFLGPGSDWIALAVSSDSTRYEVLPARWLSFGAVRAGFGIIYRTRGFGLGLSPICDFSLVRQEYGLATPSGFSKVSEPLMARPGLALEFWPLEGIWQ